MSANDLMAAATGSGRCLSTRPEWWVLFAVFLEAERAIRVEFHIRIDEIGL